MTSWTLGIDVSAWQDPIDWSLVAKTRAFAFVKATEGTHYLDATFPFNWQTSKANGMVRGAYHFARPSQNSGQAEAAYFLAHVAHQSGDLAIIDLEDDKLSSSADLRAYLTDYLSHVKAAWGAPPLIYSTTSYLRAHNCLNGADLGGSGLWIASWSLVAPTDLAGWPFWAVWQYTSRGVVPGISVAVDEDVFQGSVETLRKYGAP